ncbi:putative superfamily III holin-X [Kineococcus xinjiangensis]|uniref:Putative superfamily III holin-X n=1 Tax=Kineococcus xinjiangensis TaxID=512762 RepID=A0A2S6IF70_9ACTN|nr:phage holin family protein [Kineococcus xinjiangensis]PPK92836.1 putative superfamily III holin-X [Kineococcus xinjiangensis]
MSHPTPRPGIPGAERSIGQLVADASQDLSDLIRHEIALAKAEITADVKNGALGGALFGAAGFLGAVAFILICVALAFVLAALGLPVWAGFLIVGGVLVLGAGLLALVGYGRIKRVGPPERTIRTTKETVAVLKASATGKGHALEGPQHRQLDRAGHH